MTSLGSDESIYVSSNATVSSFPTNKSDLNEHIGISLISSL